MEFCKINKSEREKKQQEKKRMGERVSERTNMIEQQPNKWQICDKQNNTHRTHLNTNVNVNANIDIGYVNVNVYI